METTMQTTQTIDRDFSKAAAVAAEKESLWKFLDHNRFGIIPILLTVLGCLGGIAVAFGAGADLFRLSLVAFPTIITLALVLAVAPMKMISWATFIALVLDVAILLF
jgi:hypothetical protein